MGNADMTEQVPTGKSELIVEHSASAGLITLNRPKALNALSLAMVRGITAALMQWRDDDSVQIVALRGTNKVGRPGSPEGLFGGFCAGGDIRFFHQAALANDPSLEDFFTEEYTLNHLIHSYPKPIVAFMDGVVMGGGMGLCQGARVRIVTEHTKMAMPETNIGLFPDVGGGYFLSRCPGHVGEYLALSGDVIGAEDAIAYGLADVQRRAAELPALWNRLTSQTFVDAAQTEAWLAQHLPGAARPAQLLDEAMEAAFSKATVLEIVTTLECARDAWSRMVAVTLRKRSPLMLHVALEQVRLARHMALADDLRMERDMVHRCFHLRPGAASETVEGIRALAIDKDHQPRWKPERIEAVTPEMVSPFFDSPWSPQNHPLTHLQDT
jgi:enoyl-CoA hydratase/carnithine racemase